MDQIIYRASCVCFIFTGYQSWLCYLQGISVDHIYGISMCVIFTGYKYVSYLQDILVSYLKDIIAGHIIYRV